MQTQMQQIKDKCLEVMRVAELKYGLDLSKVTIRFDLKGRAAGQAGRVGNQYYMRFNHDMLGREAFDHVLNNTVPHEIAHIVCFMNPSLGSNHNHGWARVCMSLGGTGAKFHKEEVVYGKGSTYEYTTTQGFQVRCSQQLHSRIQSGTTYTYRGKGKVDKACAFTVVGINGRTIAKPAAPKAAPVATIATAAPVQHVTPAPVARPAPVVTPPAIAKHVSPLVMAKAIMSTGIRQGKTKEQILDAICFATKLSKAEVFKLAL